MKCLVNTICNAFFKFGANGQRRTGYLPGGLILVVEHPAPKPDNCFWPVSFAFLSWSPVLEIFSPLFLCVSTQFWTFGLLLIPKTLKKDVIVLYFCKGLKKRLRLELVITSVEISVHCGNFFCANMIPQKECFKILLDLFHMSIR